MNGAATAVLDERGCRKIHEAALRLLEEVGCAVLDPEALALLKANGARVDGERARFGEALVERARSTAPARYTVAGRRPELDLHVGLGEPAVLASASGPPFVLSGGAYRTGTLADLTTAVRLAHLSPNIDVLGYSVEPTDVPEERRPRVVAHLHATSSDKNCRYTVTSLAELQVATDVLEILYGADWHARAAPLVGDQHDVAAAVLGGGRAGAAASGAPRPARAGRRLRHGRHDGADHAGRPSGRAARRAARRPRAHAARQSGHAVPLRRHVVALVHAERRAHDRRAGVLVAHGGHRPARPLAGRPRARRRLRHRRAPARRPGRHRVGAGHGHRPAHRRAVRPARRRHPLVLQLLLAGEVRHRRRGDHGHPRGAAAHRGRRRDPRARRRQGRRPRRHGARPRAHPQARARRHPADDHEPRAVRDLAVPGRARPRRRRGGTRRGAAAVLRAAGRPGRRWSGGSSTHTAWAEARRRSLRRAGRLRRRPWPPRGSRASARAPGTDWRGRRPGRRPPGSRGRR